MKRRAALVGLVAALLATSAEAQPDPRTPAVIDAVRAQLTPDGFSAGASYAIVFSDLNDDHRPEAIVHLVDRAYCGSGGCTTFVLVESEAGWRPIGRMTVTKLPIYRLPDHHNGWFDLGVYVSGGGRQPGIRAVRFERGRYKSNPTVAPAVGMLPQQASLLFGPTSEFLPVEGN